MKRIISILTLIAVLASCISVITFADSDKVEISFCVGDETLTINGNGVKVEKPYVVGAGVTLVPLRVITEAFGAVVGWEGTTKTVTLNYPNVEIILQIGNPIAEVNKKAQTLLAAPELTPNGITMVPLRFISETFGAIVGYDEATARITVTKGAVETGATVQGGIEAKKVGDSFYQWTMDNPSEMTVSERDFDGTYTEFIYDADDGFCVIIEKKDEDYSFDREFKEIKDSLSNMTLIQADKDTWDENRETMHFKAKNTDRYMEIILIEGGLYCYEILVSTNADSTERIKYIGDIIATFTNAYDGVDVHDLSNVINDMREYKSENMKLSFRIPVNYYQFSDPSVENELMFKSSDEKDTESYFVMDIYSASQVGTAEELAKKDFGLNAERINKKIVTINEHVNKRGYKNFDAFEYTYEVKSEVVHRKVRDVFFQVGEYVYNVAICVKDPKINTDPIMDEIINSIQAEPLNPEKTGVLMRNDGEYEGTFTYKGDEGYTLTVPNSYDEQKVGSLVLFSRNGGTAAVSLIVVDSPLESRFDQELRAYAKSLRGSVAKKEGVDITSEVTIRTIGNLRCAEFRYSTVKDTNCVNTRAVIFQKGSKLYVCELGVHEVYDSEFMNKELDDILTSFKFE